MYVITDKSYTYGVSRENYTRWFNDAAPSWFFRGRCLTEDRIAASAAATLNGYSVTECENGPDIHPTQPGYKSVF